MSGHGAPAAGVLIDDSYQCTGTFDLSLRCLTNRHKPRELRNRQAHDIFSRHTEMRGRRRRLVMGRFQNNNAERPRLMVP